MNSYSNAAPVDINRVLDAGKATRQGPSFVVDTATVQRRIDERAKTNRRTVQAGVRVHTDASVRVRAQMIKDGIGKWCRWREQQGWTLESDVQVSMPKPATDPTGMVAMPGMVEYPLRAVFKYTGKTPEPIRFELPKDGVKQAPDHRLSLQEAMKVWDVEVPEETEKVLPQQS